MKPGPKLIRITTVPISLRILLRRQLKFMTTYFDVLSVSSPGKILEEVRYYEETRTAAVPMTRSITPISDVKAVWQLYQLFKKEQPEIVHSHTPKAGLLSMIAGKMAGVPIRLHTVAGMPLMEKTGLKKKLLIFTERLTYKCATRVYPNSKNLADYIYDNKFCSADKLKVLGNGSSNGIDMEFFKPKSAMETVAYKLKMDMRITDADFVFVFIGRLVRDKGIEELVAAFSQLKLKYSNIKLLLVGEYEHELDPVAKDTRKLIDTDEDIIHAGFQKDVRPYLLISHVLTFPSYREGFPNVPMQAGCFNLPSIVTNINGCNEIIENGKNGLIIPVKEVAPLIDAMESLMMDKSMYEYMKSNARKMIFDRYEQNYFWGLLLKEYKDQLKLYENSKKAKATELVIATQTSRIQ